MAADSNQETSATAPFDALKERIAQRYPALSRQLQTIARYVLDNPNELALETVSTLASRIGVQPSSMVRFAKAMDLDGFTALQQVFRSRLVAGRGSDSYRDRIQTLRTQRKSTDGVDPQATLATFVDAGMNALEALREHTSGDEIRKATAVLAQADDIYILAQNRAFPVAFYLAYALGRLGLRSRLLDGVGGLLKSQAELATANDAFIAVSFRPYSPQVVDIVVETSERGIPVVAITDSALSPLALESSVTFEVRDSEEQAFRTLIAPMCLAQSLIVQLGHTLAGEKNNHAARNQE